MGHCAPPNPWPVLCRYTDFFTCPADNTAVFTSLHGIFFPTNNVTFFDSLSTSLFQNYFRPSYAAPSMRQLIQSNAVISYCFYWTHLPFYGLLFQPVKTTCTSGSLKSICSSSQLRAPYPQSMLVKHTLSIPSFKLSEQNKTKQLHEAHPSRLPLNWVFQAVVDSHIEVYPLLCSLSYLEVDLCCVKDSQT